ncbi:MAG: SDR family NAD(P)-dependent oxidoreductase, partial [Nitrospira sp.]
MVTGAGGSIGSELCRQLAQHQPETLILFEQHEHSLHTLELELRALYPLLNLHAVLGDVTNNSQVQVLLNAVTPDTIFHAAAYKQVPMMERNAAEAIRNNVIGTQVVAQAARKARVARMVLISTDKAVNPSSVMGATKRVAESIMRSLNQQGPTRFTTVRFGNVLGSAGSVIPLFMEQIRKGGPVTVTHPDVRRYFMTIPESVELILQAAV